MENMLQELNELRLDKIHVDTEVRIEKVKNHGLPLNHLQRTQENNLIVEGQLILEEVLALKLKMKAEGLPQMALTDILSTLYAVEGLFSVGETDIAWDALSGAIDGIENELLRLGK